MILVKEEIFEGDEKKAPLGAVVGGRPESLFGPSGADQRKAQDGCQNGQQWLAARCEECPYT